MASSGDSLSYPRRRVQRSVARQAGRALIPLLARVEVTGAEHFPTGGPLLVVGNHVAAIEVALMVAYAPWQVELLGPGDGGRPARTARPGRLGGGGGE